MLLSATILLLIILPLALSLVLDIPVVQNRLAHKAAELASRKLETRVSIDRVNIGLFNKIRLYGFYVEDYQRDTLLYVGELNAMMTGAGLFGGGLSFGYGSLADAKLYLKESPDSVMNIKQIVDRLSNRKGDGRFRLSMHSVDVSNLELHIERLEHRNPDYGVDYGNMRLRNLSGRVNDLSIAGSAVSGDIERLSFDELSGFAVEGVSGEFKVDRGVITLADAHIATAESDIYMPSLSLSGEDWGSYKNFIKNVVIDAEVEGSTVTSDDVAFFAPKMGGWKTRLTDVSMTMRGTVDNFAGNIASARIDGRSELSGTAEIRGMPDVRRSDFDVDIRRFSSDAASVERLAAKIASLDLPPRAVEILQRAGRMALSGTFTGRLDAFRTRGQMNADAGNMGFAAAMHPDSAGRGRALRARVKSENLDVGRIAGVKMLGKSDFIVRADGTFGGGSYDMKVDGDISSLVFRDYACRNISVDGRVADGIVDAVAGVRDSSLNMDLHTVLGFGGERPSYDMIMDLRRLDLAALGINRRDSVSVLSANMGLSAVGRIPDELNGEMSVANARYIYDSGDISSEYMSMVLESNEDTRSLRLESDFADALFESRNNYKDVWAYIKEVVGDYLPLLYEQDAPSVAAHEDEDEHAHRFSFLSITTKDFTPVADAISHGLQIADGSQLNVLLDPACDRFLLRAKTDYIERERVLATSLELDMSNDSDSLTMQFRAGDFYLGALHLPELRVNGAAGDNRIYLSGDFRDSVREFTGSVGVTAALRRDPKTRARGVDIAFAPSYIARKNDRWDISANGIAADSSRITIDDFSIRNSRQELLIDGVASRSRNDSLTLLLRDFDLAPLAQIASRLGYSIEGRTNGYARVKSALHGSQIVANIRLDSIEVNTIPVRPLEFDSRWDFGRNRARFTVSAIGTQDTIVRGYYMPSQVRYSARADIDSLNMALLNPILSGVVSETRGSARALLTFEGERRNAELRGDIAVRDLSTKVDFTQVTYSVPEAHINVKNNRFTVDSVTVYDPEGNEGTMSFDLSLNHLSNISYTLNVRPRQMLVLNTTTQDNDYFYGKVYASGAATIEGDKSGVVMDIVASTDDNTEFYLPLSNKSNVSNADFVIFEQADRPDTTNFLVRRKMMFERRQKQRTSSGGRMDINMALDVKPNAMFQLVIDPTVGDIIKGRGEGALNLHINPKANIFEMYGDYTITEGNYLFTLQNIINKRFIIESGSTIQWTGEPVDALLNIDAVYKLKASLQPLLEGSVATANLPTRAVPVECIIHLSDRLTNPTVNFDVVVPNADPDVQTLVANALSTSESRSQQFLYLLVANSFISEASTDTSMNLGATASVATGFELLSNQLSNWLSSEAYNIVIRYRPKTEITSDEVDIGFSTGLVDNRLLLEVEGNYLVDRSMSVNQTSNIMGEAYLTWLIDRAGNLRLRGFTHTIDRFDENQGLQETGIGIYYKESFNNLKDLKQRVKDRFTIRRRKAERAEKREERRRRRDVAKGGGAEAENPEEEIDEENQQNK